MSQRTVLSPWRRGASERASSGWGSRQRDGEPPRSGGVLAATVGRLATGPLLLARAVMAVAAPIALLIGLAILLRDVDANAGNTIVKGLHDGANFFAGSFTGIASFHGHPKRAITVDWGIALLAYLLAGTVVASMIARLGRGTRRRRLQTPAGADH